MAVNTQESGEELLKVPNVRKRMEKAIEYNTPAFNTLMPCKKRKGVFHMYMCINFHDEQLDFIDWLRDTYEPTNFGEYVTTVDIWNRYKKDHPEKENKNYMMTPDWFHRSMELNNCIKAAFSWPMEYCPYIPVFDNNLYLIVEKNHLNNEDDNDDHQLPRKRRRIRVIDDDDDDDESEEEGKSEIQSQLSEKIMLQNNGDIDEREYLHPKKKWRKHYHQTDVPIKKEIWRTSSDVKEET